MTAPLPKIETLEEFEARVVPLLYPPPPSPEAYKSKFGMLRFRDLDLPGPEMEWLVEDFITIGDKSIIAGPSGSGKSFFGVEVGCSISRGVPVFGHATKQGLVIYQAGEGATGIKKRLRAYRQHHNISPDDDIPFVLLQSRVDLFSEEGHTKPLIDEIQAIRQMYPDPLRAVFIDTLSKAQGLADENNGKDMARVLNNIDAIREATGVAICLVHHLNADGTKLRGHTSVFANIDQVIAVTCDKETKIRTVQTAKVKDGADDIRVKFELMQVKLGQDATGKDITSCVTVPVGQKEELRKLDGVKPYFATDVEKLVLRALFDALDKEGIAPPSGCSAPASVSRVVDYAVVKRIYSGLDFGDEEPDLEKLRQKKAQRLKRARLRLMSVGVFGAGDPYVWFAGRPVASVAQTWPAKRRDEPEVDTRFDDEIPF